jgi:hypothetical protein
MREKQWQSLDKDQIIDLIVKHNASVSTLAADVERRIRGKLEAMTAVELWHHIQLKYNGKLYEPDTVEVDPLELKRREREAAKPIVRVKREAVHAPSGPVTTMGHGFSKTDEAENDIYGKSCVKKVMRFNDKLLVIMEDKALRPKLIRWIAKHYPTVNAEVLE